MGQRLHRPSRRARSVTTPSTRLNECNEMQRHPAYISLHIAHRYISERTTQRREAVPRRIHLLGVGPTEDSPTRRMEHLGCVPNPRAGRPTRHHLDGGCVTHRVTHPNPNAGPTLRSQASRLSMVGTRPVFDPRVSVGCEPNDGELPVLGVCCTSAIPNADNRSRAKRRATAPDLGPAERGRQSNPRAHFGPLTTERRESHRTAAANRFGTAR